MATKTDIPGGITPVGIVFYAQTALYTDSAYKAKENEKGLAILGFKKGDPVVEAFIKDFSAKLAKEIDDKMGVPNPKGILGKGIRDGDDTLDDGYRDTNEGYWVIKFTSRKEPQLLDTFGEPLPISDLRGGAQARVRYILTAVPARTKGGTALKPSFTITGVSYQLVKRATSGGYNARDEFAAIPLPDDSDLF